MGNPYTRPSRLPTSRMLGMKRSRVAGWASSAGVRSTTWPASTYPARLPPPQL